MVVDRITFPVWFWGGLFRKREDRAYAKQSGRSPKVVAFFSATNFSSYILELLQLHDAIQIKSCMNPL